jgi:hypothetical protein
MHQTARPLTLLPLAATALLVGCSGSGSPFRYVSGLTAEQRAMAAQLPVLREAPPEGTYTVLRPVSGLSCRLNAEDTTRVSEADAIEELQRAAVLEGGNAVVEVACRKEGWPQVTCAEAIRCEGIAVVMSAPR